MANQVGKLMSNNILAGIVALIVAVVGLVQNNSTVFIVMLAIGLGFIISGVMDKRKKS